MRRGARVIASIAILASFAGCAFVVDLGPERTRFIASDVTVNPDSPVSDAGEDDDATNGGNVQDAGNAECDPNKPFNAPSEVTELTIAPIVGGARLNAEMTRVVFHARLGSVGQGSQIHEATRPNTAVPFGKPVFVPGVATYPDGGPAQGTFPVMGPDRLSIYFSSNRGGAVDVWYQTRSSPDASFAEAKSLGLDTLGYSYLTNDGKTLYHASNQSPNLGDLDIWKMSVTSPGVVGANTHVPDLSSTGDDINPVVSDDGLVAFLSRRLLPNGASTTYTRIWMAKRKQTSEPFSTFEAQTSISSDKNDQVTWISPDLCTIYFMSDRAGNLRIYTAKRPK